MVGFDLQTCSSGVIESQIGRLGYSVPGPDSSIVQGAWDQPYDFANYRVTGYRAPAMVPVGSWRSGRAGQSGLRRTRSFMKRRWMSWRIWRGLIRWRFG